ncbi:MAG: YetF domain-containing protein [Pseudomonadota bacterium]
MFFATEPQLDLATRIVVLAPLCLIVVIVATRVIGLRSFSKMTAFDFISTVAIGSLMANAAGATKWESFLQDSFAILAILAFQAVLAMGRRRSSAFSRLIENDPIMLVENGQWNETALRRTRVAQSDIWAKLREANVFSIDNVQAVVLETTGDISVLHADETVDDKILTDVRRLPHD